MNDDLKQPFLSHLTELRSRLIYCAIAVAIGFIASYIFAEDLFAILVSPLKEHLPGDDKLIFTNLPEMFLTYLKTAFVTGILLASPVIFYQLWMFIAPGLYQKEKKYVIPFVLFSTMLFVGGALFGYFVVFPFGFKFFLGYANEYIQALPTVKQYFSFSTKLLFAFGVVFELPVVIFFLARMGIVTPAFLKKNRKYAILLTFALAAIFTPPDVITQCMMAVPLIFLYEVGIIIAILFGKKQDKED
ncbi:twin-arginine translocase subunit TatC [Thermodesulfobacteriota bacterium]